MRRFVRIMAGVLLLLAAGLLAVSVGVVMPWTFRVAGPDGTPATAWVAFVHEGKHVHFAASLDWTRPGGLLKSDADGIVQLPLVIYLKPPLDDWVRHRVQTIFAPALHAILHEQSPEDGATVRLPDHTGDPEAWDHTLEELYSFLAYDMGFGESGRYEVGPEAMRELAHLAVAEYYELMATHGDTQRVVPEDLPGHLQFASREDRDAWREEMRREIEMEPTWSAYLQRRYGGPIAELEERFGD